MCLAIFKKPNAVIPEEHLKNGYESNKDGCGFCYPEDGKVKIVKGMFTWEEFISKYKEVPTDKPILIHFRFETSGKIGIENCHPFSMCENKYALIHNGVIGIKNEKEHSDTATFCYYVLEPLLKIEGLTPDKPALQFLVEQTIGMGNKIVIMDGNGEVSFFNEDRGEWNTDKTVWYSNTGYKYPKTVVRYQGHGCGYECSPYDWQTEYHSKKKESSENGSKSSASVESSTDNLNNNKQKFSDEIEMEINFCMKELSYSRQNAIDYLVYEGVLEEDEAGAVVESASNYSVTGL